MSTIFMTGTSTGLGKDQIKYLGDDAIAFYNRRKEIGDEAYIKEIDELFFGS